MSDTAAAAPAIDPQRFREALGHYPTGVVVVTSTIAGEPVGMVVGTFSSVSLDPPLVAFMPAKSSVTYAGLRQAERYCINILAHDQRDVCRTLSSRDADKFDRIAWSTSPTGVPLIDGAVAHIDCIPDSELDVGDHLFALCRVESVELARPVTPLLFFQGGYGGFSPGGMAAHLDADLIAAARVAEAARPQLDRLAEELGVSASALVQVNSHDQTIGASSYGGSSAMDERLGDRIPLVPPLGSAAVAWSPSHAEQWLDRISPADPGTRDTYETALAAVRRHGYAISRVPRGDWSGYEALGQALLEYSAGPLTPAREREVRAALAAGARYHGGSVDPDEVEVDVASVVAPVLDRESGENTGLVLRLGSLPRSVPGSRVQGWAERLCLAASEVAQTLATSASRDYERYVNSGLRDRA